MPNPLFDVPVVVHGLQHFHVYAPDADAAREAAGRADPAFVAGRPISGLGIAAVGDPVEVTAPDPPDHETLARSGRMVAAEIGRQVFELSGRTFVATWVTCPGTPRWDVEEEAVLAA